MRKKIEQWFPLHSSLVSGVAGICLCLATPQVLGEELDLPLEIRENSPVLERWTEEIPNLKREIKREPRFSSRVRLGYAQFPSPDDVQGWLLGIEDLGIKKSPLTFSADYQDSVSGDYTTIGARLQYYLLPLGSYVNLAPVLGYRYLQIGEYSNNGVNVGAKLVLSLSATGAADIFVTQNFVFSGNGDQVGITTISFGYAITSKIRLSTDLEQLNSRVIKDSRFAVILEIVSR